MPPTVPLHTIPIRDRPPPATWLDRVRPSLFNVVFFTSCIFIHAFQLLVALPLLLVPLPASHRIFRALINHSKEAFGVLLVALTSNGSFGPSSFVVTADDSIDLEGIVRRDANGDVVAFDFAKHTLFTANHQAYCDWIYIWILFALGGISEGLCIVLKASLQWVPVLGPAMQFFQFAFVGKSKPLQRNGGIYATAKQALEDDVPFSLLLFPEGTLVSRLTRPKSAAFAATSGVEDFRNVLLPRSTGLLYSLRTLLPIMPDLSLYDITIGYDGISDQGYAQDYYTLQSIFGRGFSPPRVHLHLRKIDLSTVPLGALPSPPTSLTPKQLDDALLPAERAAFQNWTYDLFAQKDSLMTEFYKTGQFYGGKQRSVEVNLGLKASDAKYASIPLGVWGVGEGLLKGWRFLKGRG